MTLPLKPAELVEGPLDGQYFAQRVNAPTNLDFRLGEIVKLSGGAAAKVAATDTTGFYLVVKDNSPGEPAGSFVDNGQEGWFAKKPATIDVVPVSGKKVILSASGTLQASHIGATKPITTNADGITVVDLAGTGTAATILGVVEGAVGSPNARVLVQLG